MRKWMILLIFMAVVFMANAHAAEYQVPVTGNITVYDANGDNSFESITSSTQIQVQWRNVNSPVERWKYRGVIEFDLDAFSGDFRAESALLKFYVTGLSNRPEMQCWGYQGDGIVELADADKGDTLITSRVIDSLSAWQIDITSYLNAQLQQGKRFIGLNLRDSSEGRTDNTYDNDIKFNGYQSTSQVFFGVKLILSDTPGTPVSPAATLYQHNFDWGCPGTAQGFQFQSSDSYGRIQCIEDLLRMDMLLSSQHYTRNEMDWTVDLDGASGLTLNYYHSNVGDENHALPETFVNSSDGDGVAISADGTTWYTIANAEDLDVGARGQSFAIDLDAEVSRIQTDYDPAFQYGPQFQIRFQQYDDHAFFGGDGRDWADLLITGTPPDTESDLGMTLDTSPANPEAGSEVTYSLQYENYGNETAIGVVLSGTLPTESYVASASPGCERVGETFTCYVGSLAPGQSGEKQIVIVPKVEGQAGFSATIANLQTDPVPGNNDVSNSIDVLPMPNKAPEVQIRVVPDGPIDEGSTITAELIHLYDPNSGDSHTLEWDFGDGNTVQGNGPFDHTYLIDGDRVIILTAIDDGGLQGSASWPVTVVNVAPVVDAGPDATVDAQTAVSFSGQFIDPGTLDVHTFSWDFGDGQQATGSLSATHAYAQPGTYTVTLTVSDGDGGVGSDTLTVTVNQVYALNITPESEVVLSGTEGGPFIPNCATYTIANTSDATVDWSVNISENWVEAATQGGTLTPGESQSMDICLSQEASQLSIGTYPATVTFEEIPSGLTYTRNLTLMVSEPAISLPVVFDFSQGLPDQDDGWTYYSSNAYYGRIQVVNGLMRMDVSVSGYYNLNEAILSLDLSGAREVTLEFFQSDHGDEPHSLPEKFTGHYNGDGVAISMDGQTWYRAIASSSLEVSSSGQTFTINLDDVISQIRTNYDPDFDYSDQFQIKFQQYDNYAYSSDGRQWDDVRISGLISNLQITPAEDVEILVDEADIGLSGCQSYQLMNTGSSDLSWTVTPSDTWLTLSASEGVLAAGLDAMVDACWDTTGFQPGETRNGYVAFADSSGQGPQIRNITIRIDGGTLRPPYVQDFTDGMPGVEQGWRYYSSNAATGRIAIVNERLRMDVNTNYYYNLNEAILTIDLSQLNNVKLRFFHSESYDESHSMSSTFTGHANADGVAVSTDDNTWYRILNATDLDVGTAGRTITVDLDAEVDRIRSLYDSTFGYTSEFHIKFQQYDNYAYSSDGREWDSISITTQ